RPSWIVRIRLSVNSAERKIVEAKIHESCDRLTHDAASPELFAEPVTQSRSLSMHVLPGANTNSAGGYALNLDAKYRCRLFAYRSPKEFVRVLDRVRMREEIA